ncbi:MAG: D-alanine--D-alanine ligase [Rubricoccaceae bacterium]|nr:D-alanine--D-alanine ligase [Rubricoccaceae bacterium]
MRKTRVGLIYGGLSSEHEVSIQSARNVYEALRPEKYEVTLIWIDRTGQWFVIDSALHLEGTSTEPVGAPLTFSPMLRGGRSVRIENGSDTVHIDVAFPVLHGQNGEDGRVQGFLQTVGIPYVGADVLGSAVCMDKEVTKRLLRDAGLPITPFLVLYGSDESALSFSEIESRFGTPFFVKPANSGSSVGITKVDNAEKFKLAIEHAFGYDKKILIEKGIAGREIECAVLGNEKPEASVVGEVISTDEFYTYDAKYIDADASWMEVPAEVPERVSDKIRELAKRACRVLGCEGMARVDFFLADDGEIMINEVNTIPGFTLRSMYPLMWEKTNLPNDQLVDRLIELALERHKRDSRISTSR